MKTLKEYKRLMADHPHKWNSHDTGYTTIAADPQHRCGKCRNFYYSLIAQRGTCEIFRGRGPERKVPSGGSCYFWNDDGVKFPRLEQQETRTATPPEGGKSDAVDE